MRVPHLHLLAEDADLLKPLQHQRVCRQADNAGEEGGTSLGVVVAHRVGWNWTGPDMSCASSPCLRNSQAAAQLSTYQVVWGRCFVLLHQLLPTASNTNSCMRGQRTCSHTDQRTGRTAPAGVEAADHACWRSSVRAHHCCHPYPAGHWGSLL